ncbi:MAG: hypothetical protein AAFU79_24820 [Myxococcota bacterium]
MGPTPTPDLGGAIDPAAGALTTWTDPASIGPVLPALSPGRFRPPRACLLFALLGGLGCAGTPSPAASPEPKAPFVKMAQRELAVLLHWRGEAPPPAHIEILGRSLERGLGDTYRVPVTVVPRTERFRGIPPILLVRLARQGIDDAVVVEPRRADPAAPLEARVEVVALATQEVLHEISVRAPPRATRSAADEMRRFGATVTGAVRRVWTTPGAAPEMDPLVAAHHLYEKGACHHAAPLFDLALSERSMPARADRIADHERTRERRRACLEQLALESRVAEDRAASFRLDVRGDGVSAPIIAALRRHASDLGTRMQRRTDKPVTVVARAGEPGTLEPGTLILTTRHNRQKPGQPVLDRTTTPPRIDLEPLRPVFEAMMRLRENAAQDLGGDLGLLLSRFSFRVRLEHLLGSALVFEFVDVGGAPVLGPRALVIRPRSQVILQARSPDDLRKAIFQLGPWVDRSGRPTQDALVGDFFSEGSTTRP